MISTRRRSMVMVALVAAALAGIMQTPTKSFEVIELLTRHRVDFMVVGMTAGVLQGAPAVTFDLDIAEGMTFRVLSLERLIEVKRLAGRPKDFAVIPLLEATLARRRSGLGG